MRTLAALLGVAGALASAGALGGCGFTPLYAEPAVWGLGRVAVTAPDTRAGFELRQQLEDALGGAPDSAPLWRLDTRISQERMPLGRRIDDTATRYQLTVVVDYELTGTVTDAPPIRDSVTAVTTYAASDQAYASIAAQRDGEARVIAEAARLIRLDLARFLATPPD